MYDKEFHEYLKNKEPHNMGFVNGLTGQEALDYLCDRILKDDHGYYYIEDPISNTQANAIIVDDILCEIKRRTPWYVKIERRIAKRIRAKH